jgi:hypothetical protein
VSQADNIERHSCLLPNGDGSIDLPPDFTPFSPEIAADLPDRSHLPDNNNNNIMTSNESSSHPNTSNTQESLSSPLISRRIFTPSSPPALPDNITSTEEPEHQLRPSTRSNLGSAPDNLDPSTHALKYHHQATNNNGSNVTSIEHYYNVLGIKLPSATRARTTSQGGCLKTSYTSKKQNLPKVKRNQLNSYYLTFLNWSKLLNVCHTGMTTLDAFKCEIHKNITYENGHQLLEYFNPALLITVANKEDNPKLKEAMNGPDAAGFMKAMEIEIETLIRMDAFVVADRESWMNVISSVWAFKRKRYPDGSI